MNKIKVYFGLFLCFMLLFGLTGCQEPESIKIGFSAGLSGSNSEVGIGARNAVELMVDQVNEAGGINGRQVELLVQDDENSLEKVAEVDQGFIDAGVLVIIGHDMSSKVATSLKVIKDQNVLMISPTISDYRISGMDDNFMRTIPTNFDQGSSLAEFASAEDQVTRVMAIVDSSNQSFYEGIVKGFESVIGNEIEVIAIENGVSDDVDGIMTRYKASDCQGILLVLNSKDVAYLVQRSEEQKIDAHFYSSNWGMTQDVIEQGGNAVDGVRFVSMIDLLSQGSAFLEFKNAYLERYKKEPNFSAVYSYEASQLVIAALQKTSKMTYLALKTEILGLSPFEGIQGTLNVDPYGDVKRVSNIYTVDEGQFIKLK